MARTASRATGGAIELAKSCSPMRWSSRCSSARSSTSRSASRRPRWCRPCWSAITCSSRNSLTATAATRCRSAISCRGRSRAARAASSSARRAAAMWWCSSCRAVQLRASADQPQRGGVFREPVLALDRFHQAHHRPPRRPHTDEEGRAEHQRPARARAAVAQRLLLSRLRPRRLLSRVQRDADRPDQGRATAREPIRPSIRSSRSLPPAAARRHARIHRAEQIIIS